MGKRRFSKKLLKNWLEERFFEIQKNRRFDQGNGWAQVDGKGEEANRAYGEWRAYEIVLNAAEFGFLEKEGE